MAVIHLPPQVVYAAGAPAPKRGAALRALKTREEIWPDAAQQVWDRKKHKGFTSVPRTMPYIELLMDSLCKNAPPSAAYRVLWMRGYEEHVLKIENPAMLAAESGYTGQRAAGTWAQRMRSLVELGFIRAKKGPVSEFQTVLIRNPNLVVMELARAGRFRNEAQQVLFDGFKQRAIDIGAKDVLDALELSEKGEGLDAPTSSPSGATSPAGTGDADATVQ